MNIPNSGTGVKWMEHDGETQNFLISSLDISHIYPQLSQWSYFFIQQGRLVHGTVSEHNHGFFNEANPFYSKWRDDHFLWKSIRSSIGFQHLGGTGSPSGNYSHTLAVSFLWVCTFKMRGILSFKGQKLVLYCSHGFWEKMFRFSTLDGQW